MTGLWLANLKRFVTGTLSGGKYGLDVNVLNTITTSSGQYAYKERRFHLPASTTIPGKGSAMVEVDLNSETAAGTPSDIANTISEIGINWNGDGCIEFGVGANAAAAASNIVATVGAGQTRSFGVSLVATNKLWLRSIETATIVDGELLVTLLG